MTEAVPQIFDRALYLSRQARAREAQGPLLDHVAQDLHERLSVINHEFANCLLIAPSDVHFQAVLESTKKFQQVTFRAPESGDDLQLEPASFAAVISLLDLHCVNDVPGYLAQCARALTPDGLFMTCCFAAETLQELRASWLAAESEIVGGASLRIAPMIGVREMGGLLQRAGLALPVTDNDHLTLRYADALALVREIKTFGFANPLIDRRKAFTSQRMLGAVLRDYQINYADPDGRVRASLDLLWALAWKPHDSQPKPLKPGSAKARLADVLKQLDSER